MKRLIMVTFSLIFLCGNLFAQKIKINENKVDKFSGERIVSTKLEQLCFKNSNLTAWHSIYLALRRVNDMYVLQANIFLPELEKFVDDSGVSFLTDQGKTVSLNTMYTRLGTPDSLHKESYFFSTVFRLSQNDIELLHSNRITDIRIRYLGGSFDMEIPEKKRDLIIRMFNCIEETIKE